MSAFMEAKDRFYLRREYLHYQSRTCIIFQGLVHKIAKKIMSFQIYSLANELFPK